MKYYFLSAKSSIFTDAEADDVSTFLSHHVAAHALHLACEGNAAVTLRHRQAGSLDLCQLSFGAAAQIMCAVPDDAYLLQIVLRGCCMRNGEADSPPLGMGQLAIANPREPIDLNYAQDSEILLISIPAMSFTEVCRENRWSKNRKNIRFSVRPKPIDEFGNLHTLLALLCQEAENPGATPQILQYLGRALACKLISELESDVCTDVADEQTDCFRRLVKFIEQNIRDEITAEALARHASISLRSLYLLFEKNANTTPKNFIRQKKLEQVYSTLMDPARNIINVTAVALDYGFTHLGHFSEFYKTTYGMLPSEAMRRKVAERATAPSVEQ